MSFLLRLSVAEAQRGVRWMCCSRRNVDCLEINSKAHCWIWGMAGFGLFLLWYITAKAYTWCRWVRTTYLCWLWLSKTHRRLRRMRLPRLDWTIISKTDWRLWWMTFWLLRCSFSFFLLSGFILNWSSFYCWFCFLELFCHFLILSNLCHRFCFFSNRLSLSFSFFLFFDYLLTSLFLWCLNSTYNTEVLDVLLFLHILFPGLVLFFLLQTFLFFFLLDPILFLISLVLINSPLFNNSIILFNISVGQVL